MIDIAEGRRLLAAVDAPGSFVYEANGRLLDWLHAHAAALLDMAEDAERMRVALRWYGAEAESIARNMQTKPPRPEACLASLTVLSLDAGKRAIDAARGKL